MCIIRPYTYYGGKIRFLKEIKSLIPEHKSWYEPFMGSAVVTLNTMRSKEEVINDLNPEIYNLMSVLAHKKKGKLLIKELFKLEHKEETFKRALEQEKTGFLNMNDIDKAVAKYVLLTMSFNSVGKNYRKGVENVKYRQDLRLHLPKIIERLENVKVTNMNGIDLLGQIKNNEQAFAFVDPPYRKELRGAKKVYQCELSDKDQKRLLETIKFSKCKIMLCGYRKPQGEDLYDKYLIPYGWRCYKLADTFKACQTKKKKDVATEYIWVNYELPDIAQFFISVKEYNSLNKYKRSCA